MGRNAGFYSLSGITIDAQNNIYVADQGNFMIRKITPVGVVSTLAGNGTQGSSDGPATTATFNSPAGITIDKQGDLYITDNNLVRKVASDGTFTTIAGDVTGTIGSGTDGVGIAASFLRPQGITLDMNGNLFVADTMDNLIRKITFQ
jgi:sugar lactone lactonase YvrE